MMKEIDCENFVGEEVVSVSVLMNASYSCAGLCHHLSQILTNSEYRWRHLGVSAPRHNAL